MPATIPHIGEAILGRLLGRTGVEELYRRVRGTAQRLPADKTREYQKALGNIFTNRGGGILEAGEDLIYLGLKVTDDVAEQFLGWLRYGGFTDDGLHEVFRKNRGLALFCMGSDVGELSEHYQRYVVDNLRRLGINLPGGWQLKLMDFNGLGPDDALLESIILYKQNSVGFLFDKLYKKQYGAALNDAALIAAPPLIEAALGRLHSDEFFPDNALAFLIASYTRLVEEGKVAPGQRYGGIAAEYEKYKPAVVVRNMWAAFDQEMAAPR